MAMGAADIVPGVSGGTIAFITGIYEELIHTIKSVDLRALRILFTKGVPSFWKHINGWFLVSVFAGIAISFLSLVKLIRYLLENQPILLWSFFFGLILASAYTVSKTVEKWNARSIVALLVGGGIAFYISIATPAETPESSWFIFLSGSVAICAMILPGISGSFILLLLRKYDYMTAAISDLKVGPILTFGAGAVVGLAAFSRVLSWLFKRYRDITIALLSGFMVGSLNVVWPWKEVVQWRTDSHGEEVPFLYESVSPLQFDGENNLILACTMCVIGFAIIIVIDRISSANESINNG